MRTPAIILGTLFLGVAVISYADRSDRPMPEPVTAAQPAPNEYLDIDPPINPELAGWAREAAVLYAVSDHCDNVKPQATEDADMIYHTAIHLPAFVKAYGDHTLKLIDDIEYTTPYVWCLTAQVTRPDLFEN